MTYEEYLKALDNIVGIWRENDQKNPPTNSKGLIVFAPNQAMPFKVGYYNNGCWCFDNYLNLTNDEVSHWAYIGSPKDGEAP